MSSENKNHIIIICSLPIQCTLIETLELTQKFGDCVVTGTEKQENGCVNNCMCQVLDLLTLTLSHQVCLFWYLLWAILQMTNSVVFARKVELVHSPFCKSGLIQERSIRTKE